MLVLCAGMSVGISLCDTKAGLTSQLERCEHGHVLLEEPGGSGDTFVKIIFGKGLFVSGHFGIGVCGTDVGSQWQLLLRPWEQRVVIGFSCQVVGVSIPEACICFRLELRDLFRGFMELQEPGLTLIFTETGVVAVSREYEERWRYYGDLIENAGIGGEILWIKGVDTPLMRLNLSSGKVLDGA